MAYQITHKAAKAALFHWMTTSWQIQAFAEGQISYADVIDEMMMLNMEDLVHNQPILVYGTYKNVVEFAKDYIGNHK